MLQGKPDLAGARIAQLVPPGREYVSSQWGIWRAGGIAVPLCPSHPEPELEYVLRDAQAECLILHPRYRDRLGNLCQRLEIPQISTERLRQDPPGELSLPEVESDRDALILYTSGTTSRPKGVVLSHANLQAQIESLIEAWEWTSSDRILHVLPLHHTHGIVNALLCPLWAGAVCEMKEGFEPEPVWERFSSGEITLFMAVPTVYSRLIADWEGSAPPSRQRKAAACTGLRLMISGSAALPASAFESWRRISGHDLLERYGMTEIGMALSNPLSGERRPGCVGSPLPGVEVCLADDSYGRIEQEGISGQILVRGPGVFTRYWNRPEATREAFRDGWFLTGDVALIDRGAYRILGRSSVDIIKTGGYKVSALEIEEALRQHPRVRECAVVGMEDAEWGERVCAAVVVDAGPEDLDLDGLRSWGKRRLAPYKVPSRFRAVAQLPRNAMGKVVKPQVRRLFQSQSKGPGPRSGPEGNPDAS